MKLDISKIDIAALESVVKSSDDAEKPIADDIVAQIYGDDKAGYEKYLKDKAKALRAEKSVTPTVKDISKIIAKSHGRRRKLGDFPKATKESDDPDILIRGAWLERGGSAFLVSTAGTGKSIWVTQFAITMVHGAPFCGLQSWRPLKCWVVQTEDSDRRVAIDRDDIVAGLTDQWANHAEWGKIDWTSAANAVEFVDFTGYTGAAFLEQLRTELEAARDECDLPDVIVINPYMDFLGADIVSNADNIAFLSGGVLAGKRTEGLRSILRDFKIAALIAHHTGKPPTDSELNAWICSDMPEYKACGASYVTNWGRSFVTMMKLPGMEGFVMLTAGKNGGGLGWPMVEGSRRIFMRWGGGESCAGTGQRHFWQMVEGEEYEKCVEKLREICGRKGQRGRKPLKEINVQASAVAFMMQIKNFVNLKRDEIIDKWHEIIGPEYARKSAEAVIDHVFDDLPNGYYVQEVKNHRFSTKILRME